MGQLIRGYRDAALAVMAGAARRETAETASRISRGAAARSAVTTTQAPMPVTTVQFESMTVAPASPANTVRDPSASGRYALALSDGATVSGTVMLPESTALTIRAKSSSGAPNMTLSIDGVIITTVTVTSTNWPSNTVTGVITAGSHLPAVSSSNASSSSTLYLDSLSTSTGSVGDEFLGKSKSVGPSVHANPDAQSFAGRPVTPMSSTR